MTRKHGRVAQAGRTIAAALEHRQSEVEAGIRPMDTANCTGANPATAMTWRRCEPVALASLAGRFVGVNCFMHG